MAKIHKVTIGNGPAEPAGVRLIRAHTKAGALRFARDTIKPQVSAEVATQNDLVALLGLGVAIEDATNSPQASIPEPSHAPSEKETQA